MIKLLRPLLAWAMRRALQDRFPPEALAQLIRYAWQHYENRAQDLPAEPTPGARIMVRLAAVTVGIYKSLRAAGLAEAEARERTSQVAWRVYEKLAMPPWWLTRLLSRSHINRVKKAIDSFMRFPYAAPGYRRHYVEAEENTVS